MGSISLRKRKEKSLLGDPRWYQTKLGQNK